MIANCGSRHGPPHGDCRLVEAACDEVREGYATAGTGTTIEPAAFSPGDGAHSSANHATIERDDFPSNRYLALIYSWGMIPRVEPEGMLFRKQIGRASCRERV